MATMPTTSASEQAMGATGQACVEQVFGSSFASTVLPPVPTLETMSMYFNRLRDSMQGSLDKFQKVESITKDGIYLHKRPVHAPNGGNPLAVAGTVLQHCVVYVKVDGQLSSLDFGPADGLDVTRNILEEAAARRTLVHNTAAVPPEDTQPFMYLGLPAQWLPCQQLQQALDFAESRKYHAVRNNCIHFADFVVRVLTRGAVRGAPLLYDLLAGEVPPEDNPMLGMMQLLLGMTWVQACDASLMATQFLASRSDAAAAVSLTDSVPEAASSAGSSSGVVLPAQGQLQQPQADSGAATAAMAAGLASALGQQATDMAGMMALVGGLLSAQKASGSGSGMQHSSSFGALASNSSK